MAPPKPWSVFTCPAPCSLQPHPLPAGRLRLPHRDCPLLGVGGEPSVAPLAPRWAPEGLSSPGVGTGGGGGTGGLLFLLVASPRAILQVGLYACCSFLNTNSCHGWVWDGIMLRWGGRDGHWLPGPGLCWCWGQMGHGLPQFPSCPIQGGGGFSLCQIPAGLPSPSSSSQGAAVTPALSLRQGSAWHLPLSFWGSGVVSDFPPPTPGSLAVRVWLGGVQARQRCPGLCRCLPRPGL